LNANHLQTGALRPRLFNGDGQMISVHFKTKPQDLKEGEAVWNQNGIYYRAAAGEKPAEKEFYGTYKESGVVLLNHNYVVVNNIVTENFANDGVNAHGSCRGLIFRNLISRWNGDDGFSIHEDVQACLYGAHLHHNDFGIQDISISRSSFFGVLSEDNRSIGGDFHGGMRSIEDSMFRNNGEMQLRFATNGATYMGLKKDNPLENARAYLKDVLVCGGRGAALQVKGKADVTAFQCTFANTETGIDAEEKGAIHLVLCAIANVGQNIVGKDATLTAASCAFSPAPMIWGDQKLDGDAFRNILGDATNSIQPLRFNDKYRVRSPILLFRKELKAPGFASPIDIPFIPKPPEELLATEPITTKHEFDFETFNPWSRFYMNNAKMDATVKGNSVLSREQAASGAQSAKISIQFPPAPAAYSCFLKLFTVQFHDCEAPLQRVSCMLYGAKQGNSFRLRVRDKDGECFYGPMQKLNWDGWKRVTWDITKVPPVEISGGNLNRQQDGPPLEIVLEIFFESPPEGHAFECFVDDLSFE
ncbi:MAG: hypothetical protein IKX48_09835, partial [Victivallales bacterium]|nr:hypothetical protein [Victivallales bacterium]